MDRALQEGLLDVIGLGRPLIVDPAAAKKILAHCIDDVPSFERTLALDKHAAAQRLAPEVFTQAKGWGIQSWFCVQLLRLGQGLKPDPDLTVLDAFCLYQDNERRAESERRKAMGMGMGTGTGTGTGTPIAIPSADHETRGTT